MAALETRDGVAIACKTLRLRPILEAVFHNELWKMRQCNYQYQLQTLDQFVIQCSLQLLIVNILDLHQATVH